MSYILCLNSLLFDFSNSFLHFSNHVSNNFCVSPLFTSYALFLVNIFCSKSPYTTIFNSLSTRGIVSLNPGIFSIPTMLKDITGTFSNPASLSALRMNPM